MITSDEFTSIINMASEVLPFSKKFSDSAIVLMYMTLPAKAREELTPEQLIYACSQRMLDPDPPKELPLHLALLRYLYRLENGNANIAWGLKPSLQERMQRPDVFHRDARSLAELDPAEAKARAAEELRLAGGGGRPSSNRPEAQVFRAPRPGDQSPQNGQAVAQGNGLAQLAGW